jgi:hypothetical protein
MYLPEAQIFLQRDHGDETARCHVWLEINHDVPSARCVDSHVLTFSPLLSVCLLPQ